MGGAISSKYIRGCGLNHLLSTTVVCVLLTGLVFPCVMGSQAQHIINADNILGYLLFHGIIMANWVFMTTT